MSSLRNALRCIFFALVFTAPLSAYAVNYDVRVLFDTDANRATGCTVPTANGPVAGVEQVLTTSVSVNGGTGTVTGVTRQVCVNGLFFSDPVPVNGGWNVGVSPTGNLFIETHVGANVMTMTNISTMRLAFTVTSGGLTDAMTSDFGDDILYPVRPGRRRAVSTGAPRTIHLDGVDTDWAGVAELANGDAASPALRFLDASAYADPSDLFFNFHIQTNANAPTALDDFYALGTIGGTLSVGTLGVLNNDSDPNHLSLSAFVVEGPEHGTLTLNANGGFTYTHDGSNIVEDHFRYRVTNGTLQSNLATVTISLPGSHPYTFTSADHVTFTAGQLNTFHVTVAGNPTPALTEEGTLPSGVTFTDNGDGTGTLSGTPAAGTVGTYHIVFHAEKNKPHQSDQNFTLTVICSAITVTNPNVNTVTINTPFSQTFTQSGGAAPIAWSKSGALPAGLTFNTSTGVLSGTPTQGGTFPIIVTATDVSGCTGTGTVYTLTIVCNTVTVTNPGTTSGTVNVAFSQTFTQSGGVGATTFSLASGTLPAGLTLNAATGVLSGTPTQKGSFPIVVRATDSHGCAGDGSTFPLNIGCQVISVTNPATNTGTVNVAFSQTFTSGNAIAPVLYSLNSGTLPAGITLNASTGVLSGTPTQTGSFPITIKATDANGCFGIGATYTLTISCQVITVTNPGTNSGTVNVAFSQTFTAGNAIAPVTFSLNSGSLPAGITLNAATGVLSGTPTQTGSFPITVKATDANGCFGIGATYTLTIGCQVITVTNPATNSGTVNAAFSQTFTAANTIGAKTFTTASTLPTGLTLSTAGVLSGTPTQTGSFPIVVHVVDANGCSANGATYTLTINCQVITVTNPATNTGVAGTAFSQSFTQTGGFGATTFSTLSTLPSGLTLSSAGVLSGTPTQTGSFPIVVTATDANGCTGSGATYTLVINCQTITVTNPLTTTGTAGTAFSQTFTQTGGIGATTFSTVSTLPTGLTLSSGGVLSGTPTQTGSFPIVVKATDSNGCTGSGSTYTLVINCQTITVTNPATTTGIAGTAFSQTFTQSSAIGGATFSLNSGSLPAGLTLSAAGLLSGTPTQTGSFPITVKVTDGNGCTGVGATYTLVVGCQTITVTKPATTTGTIQVAFSQTFTQSGAIGGATFSLNSGSLPAGLTLSSAGLLSGTPTVTGSFPITVKVTDGNSCTGVSSTYTLVINCQTITVTNPATNTGTVSAPFTQTFTQTGANGTATFTTASTLPAGLSLATNGTLSGTPTQSGTFPIVVTVTDSNGCTGTGSTYTLIISCQTITVTNPVVNSGAAGAPFSQTFTQAGGIGTITWSESGALPTGLTFHTATGVLDGTPSGSGSFPITVTATDSNGCTGTGPTYTLTITCPTITVTNPGVSTGTAGTAFSQTFTQSGGQGTITWSETGALPSGITLNTATGVLSGTTSQAGSFPITVTAADSNGCTGTGATYTLTINCQTITVTNPGVNTGTVDAPFSQTFTQTGILGTVTWSETGTLPAGITLNSATGVLSGTPTVNGSFPITVKATDTNGCFGTSPYTLTISCQTITVTKPVVTTGTVDTAFSQTFTQSGVGTHTPATFTLNSGSLPSGLSLSTAGVLSGTPGQPGSFPITVKVTDANGCSGVSTTYTLVISCQTITVTNPATTTGTVGVAFSQTFTQSGVGTHTPATFTTASTLPTGFSLSTSGVLSGTTNQHGSFPIVVTVTDANGCTGTGSTYTLVINCQTITVTNPATNTGTVAAPFTQTFTQTGANGTATFTTASTLPAGLSLATNGTLSGTPTQSGTFPIVVTVTDSNGCTGTGSTYTLIISCQTITVTNPVVNSGAAGAPFSQTFTQAGGIGTITWSESGALPTGLTFHTATGVLDGTPSGSGSFPITVTATDSNGCTGTGPTYTLTITCPTITVTNPGVSTGTAGTAFSQTFTQSGGQGTITWSETGALPSGISLNTASGVLSGTTSQVGSFPITVTATDSNGCTGTGATYTLTINCQTITVTNPGVNTGTVDAPFSQTFTQTGILGTVTWSETGTLPAGITLNSATGVLSGTPTVNGSFPITVKATDTNGCFGTSSYTLTINCQTITVTKPVVTTGTVGTPFSQTFTQTGAHGTATFTTASTLPSGLSLSTAGVLSGTPGVPGSFPIVVTVTDSNGCTGSSLTYTLVIACQTITVTNPATTTGTVGVAFSQTFTQSGAVGTATFTTASTLPTGFSLSTSGVLSGTTNQHGSFPIVVTVTDANGCTGTGSTYTLVINCQTITVTNPGVNTGTVSAPFSQTFTQTGAIGGATFTTASTLPTGITLSAAGLLSGTPLQSGSFPIVVTVTDGNGCTGSGATYTLVIACNVISVTNPGVTTGTVDAAFSQTFTQSGGNGTITWSKTGAIPAGMTFHSATGVLDGTPTVPGSFPITVTATDSNGCTGSGATYTLVIACQTITVTNPATTTGTVDAAFSQTFTQSGVGTHTPATFTLNSGSLPSGLSLSTAGVLSGTPGQPGSFPITVKVTDANGCTGISTTYTLVIACQTITVTNPLTASGVFNTAFSQTFTQSGVGTHTPATFTINSGTLPTGLSLSTAGVLSGTPSQTGTFPITVKVTDANGCSGIGATYNLAITPSAGPDSYSNLVDNTQAVVTGGATASPGTPFVSLTGSVLANDLPAGGVSVSAGTVGTTAGGSVTIASDGTFIYTPKANPGAAATTTDSFNYTATSNTGGTATPTTAIGTVTLNLAGRVWYVKNNGGGTNGQSQSPFTTLAAAAAASTANDIIFVYNGDGTNSGQNAGISLKNGQQLLGEVNGLIVNAQTLVAVGARPTIGNAAGDGVTVAATAASLTGVFIKGFSLAGTANGINLNSSGANTLTATVDNVVVTNATANNGIKIAGASTTTTTVTVQNSTVSGATQNGIDAQQTSAGNLVLSINNDAVTATGIGININGAGSTSTSITNFANNTVSGNTGGSGIVVTSATFDATPGGAFQTVSGGTTVIGSAGNGVGAAGMVLTNVAGDLSFTDLDIVSSNGAGLFASGTTPYTGSAGFQIAVGAGVATIDATGGPAADLNTVTANLPFSTIKSTNSASTGVSLVTVPGTFTAGAGSSITNSTGTDFNISGSNATVTYDGTITDASGRAVAIASTTGGTKSFTGAITNNGGTGISLTSNTGATINFSGTIILSTGSSDAFTATGGGTVSATDTNSTLTTTTGIALNVANTTIGASNLKFKSITAGTAASGPSNGIILNNTGASGGLIVIGTGSAGSGGTIQKTTASGISLTSVGGSASFTDMNITNTASDGITAATVKNFACSLCVITNPGTSANKDGIRMTEASGTASLTNVTVTGATTDGVNITNSSATLTSLSITGGSLSSTNNAFASADSGLIVIAKGTGVITAATVSGVTFTGNFSSGLQSFAQDTAFIGDATLSANGITVSGCTFTNNGAAAADFDAGTGTGTMKFRFLNNLNITGNKGPVVNVFSSSTATGGLIQGRIDGNHIGTAGVVDSGSTGGAGIRVFLQGVAGNITIANNVIRSTSCSRGIEVQTLGPAPSNGLTRQSDIVITGNDVDNVSSDCAFPLNDIYLTSDNQAGTATILRADVHSNKIKTAGATPANTDFPFDNLEWLYFDHTAGTAQLVGSGANANSVIAATQTSGSAKANAAVSLIAGPITTVP